MTVSTHRALIWMFAVIVCAVSSGRVVADGDVVERRGALPPLFGEVTGMDDAGVYISGGVGRAAIIVPWDRVRSVTTSRTEPMLEQRLETATKIWRARSRVERGDHALAEPVLERLFEQSIGQTSETARVIAEGLLRCRLHRGANAAAVIPGLEVIRLHRADVSTASYRALASVLDERMELIPQLAPAWVSDRALMVAETRLAKYDAQGDEVVAALAGWFRRAASASLRRTSLPDSPADVVHPGVALVAAMVNAQSGAVDVREAARDRLRDRAGWLTAVVGGMGALRHGRIAASGVRRGAA